jgi:anti-sigma factor RsiW
MSTYDATRHAPGDVLASYVAGGLDTEDAESLERHLLGCATCRTALAAHVDTAPLEEIWLGVESAVRADGRSRWSRAVSWLVSGPAGARGWGAPATVRVRGGLAWREYPWPAIGATVAAVMAAGLVVAGVGPGQNTLGLTSPTADSSVAPTGVPGSGPTAAGEPVVCPRATGMTLGQTELLAQKIRSDEAPVPSRLHGTRQCRSAGRQAI